MAVAIKTRLRVRVMGENVPDKGKIETLGDGKPTPVNCLGRIQLWTRRNLGLLDDTGPGMQRDSLAEAIASLALTPSGFELEWRIGRQGLAEYVKARPFKEGKSYKFDVPVLTGKGKKGVRKVELIAKEYVE